MKTSPPTSGASNPGSPHAGFPTASAAAGVRIATYERRVAASPDRVWENVFDWEHLPWLHSGSFGGIELIDSGSWGWRARITLPGGSHDAQIGIELLTEREQRRYVTRTVEGPGAGNEIWTHVLPVVSGEAVVSGETDIRVEFFVSDPPGQGRDALGRGYVALYTRLWDEDEAMMRHREAALSERGVAPRPAVAVELGSLDAVRRALPLHVEFGGRPFRVVEVDAQLIAHSAICPHWLGPLEGDVEAGELVCPWHGYRFDVRLGRSCDGRGLRLPAPPLVEVDDRQGTVTLRPG